MRGEPRVLNISQRFLRLSSAAARFGFGSQRPPTPPAAQTGVRPWSVRTRRAAGSVGLQELVEQAVGDLDVLDPGLRPAFERSSGSPRPRTCSGEWRATSCRRRRPRGWCREGRGARRVSGACGVWSASVRAWPPSRFAYTRRASSECQFRAPSPTSIRPPTRRRTARRRCAIRHSRWSSFRRR